MKQKYKILLTALLLLLVSFPMHAKDLPFEKSEYAMRRAAFMENIPDGVAVILGSRSVPQNNDLNYLCGVDIPGTILIVDGIRKESIIFYSTSERYLKGEGLSAKLYSDPVVTTGIEKYYPADQFTEVLDNLAKETGLIYTFLKTEEREKEISTSDEWDGRPSREQRFAELLKKKYPDITIKDCSDILWKQRQIKTAAEIEEIRKAGILGAKAMIEVMKAGHPEQYEYELSSLFEYTCKKEGAPVLAFPTIISSAENHNYPHYCQYDRWLTDGDFLVVDAGPKINGYCIDISISFPINGKFTPRQREIYQACLEVSKGCIAFYKPGITGHEVGKKVRELLEAKGYDLSRNEFTRLRFFKEGGLTHWVGLIPHDAGGKDLDPDQELKPGMVFACDLMAIFPDEDLGVRVENTVLITETGCEVLNPGIPREIDEIEALMSNEDN